MRQLRIVTFARFAFASTNTEMFRRLVNELHLYRRETLARGAENFAISTREHGAIVEAIAKGDGKRAGELLYEHAMDSRHRLHVALDK